MKLKGMTIVTIPLAVALAVAVALALTGPSIAWANGQEGLGPMQRDPGPPVPTQLRKMSAEQFGLYPWYPGPQVDDILRQEIREQVNPHTPHRSILNMRWGPLYHRDPSQIPTPSGGTGPTCIKGIAFFCP